MTAPNPNAAMQPLRVMLVDDHALVRSAVRQALTAPDIEVVGEAATAEETLANGARAAPGRAPAGHQPAGTDGLRLLRELAPRLPETRIVILTRLRQPRATWSMPSATGRRAT